jgi:U4/U6 small nuclear ribonucleoprotein PRP31
MAESSLAADLLADFNDSDEEEVDENGTSEISYDLADQPNGRHSRSRDLMELDGDEEADDDDDEEMTGVDRSVPRSGKGDLSIDDDEETRRTKVESMHLGGVDDVASVAKLMKVLEPVLEVCCIRSSVIDEL